MKRLVVLLIILGIAGMLAACSSGQDTPEQAAMAGFVGRDFSGIIVQDLDGKTQPLKDALLTNGKPVVVNVWATWCGPCLEELPSLDALGRQGQYTVLAIATDKDTKTVKDFLKKQAWGAGVTVLFDKFGQVTKQQMGASNLPTSYVLDKNLMVKDVEVGDRVWDSSAMAGKMAAALK